MVKTHKLLAMILVLIIAVTSVSFAAPNEKAAAALDKKVLTKLNSERAMEHIVYLSEVIGPRVAGTAEEREAAEYIKKVFEEYGYNPVIQEFSYNDSESSLFVKEDEITAYGAYGQYFTGYSEVTGNLVDCNLGLLTSEFPDEVRGNIALIKRGSAYGITGYFSLKAKMAQDAGAAAVIIYSTDNSPFGPTMQTEHINIPVVMISKNDGEALLAQVKAAASEGESVQATVNVELLDVYSQNVIAVKEPTNKKKSGIVYVTAHYDSVPGAPGANDNASGTAMMLEYARILKSLPTDKEVRFIACGAEEVGLEGSFYYVENLSQEEIERSIANFNMDMIATSYEDCTVLEVSTVDGEPNYVSELAVAAGARLGNLTKIEAEYGISSDHRYFGYIGIPHGGFIWRSEDGRLEPWYHQPQDTIKQNISLERFTKAGEIIGTALYEALRKPTPSLKKSAVRKINNIFDAGAVK